MYRLDRLKPRASQFRGAPAKVLNGDFTQRNKKVVAVPDLDKERP
jgi:hypothetical protein